MGIDILTLAAAKADKPKYEQPDWGSVSEFAEVLPETAFPLDSLTDEGWLITEPFLKTPVGGNAYIVNWNGTEYECPAEEVSIGGTVSMVMFGNEYAFNEEDPTQGVEPFIIAAVPPELAAEMGAYGIIMPLWEEALGDGDAVTISISEKSSEYHQIPAEYLEPTDKKKITITIAEDGTVTSDTPITVAEKMDMTELQGAVKIVDGATGEEYSACFATTGINFLGVPYITIGFIPAQDVRDTHGLSQSIHTLDWVAYGAGDRFVHSSVQSMPRCNGAEGSNFYLVWEPYGKDHQDEPSGNGGWRAYGLERFRAYLAPRWIKTETITVAEDTTSFEINTDHIEHEEFHHIDDVFIRMCTPASTSSGIVQAYLYGRYDSDGYVTATANSAISTKERYTLFRIKNVYGYLEMETTSGGDNASPATWKGMIPSSYMKVRGQFEKIIFRTASNDVVIPAGTTFEVWAANTWGDQYA